VGLNLINLYKQVNNCSWFLSDLKQTNNIQVFSTFACGGGSSMGYKLAGANVLGANDIDPEMAWHYQQNLKPELYYLCPIKELLNQKLDDRLYNLDILDGSPPCSSFSMAGKRERDWSKEKKFREGQAKQVLSDLFFDYLDLVKELKPKVAIAENVKGMLIGNAKGYTKLVIKRFEEIGYRVQVFLINGKNCGVPQARQRVFFCAIRSDLYKKKLILQPKEPIITAGEALQDIVLNKEEQKYCAVSEKFTTLWKATLPGNNFEKAHVKLYGRPSWFTNVRMHSGKPASTLTATDHDHAHWSEPRIFCFRERKRLQSFPDDYVAKKESLGNYLVGMSVPPKMTEQVAKAVINQWLS